jgi:hypothetical protein
VNVTITAIVFSPLKLVDEPRFGLILSPARRCVKQLAQVGEA